MKVIVGYGTRGNKVVWTPLQIAEAPKWHATTVSRLALVDITYIYGNDKNHDDISVVDTLTNGTTSSLDGNT